MDHNDAAARPRERVLVTAEQWYAGGERIPYDPDSARVLPGGPIRVFQRLVGADPGVDATWLTMLPGFPDGSYGWAQVDGMLGDDLGPRLYVEPVGQGDSDAPRKYRYSTMERADLVEALWRHHGVRRTVVVTFDYTSLALLELLRRKAFNAAMLGARLYSRNYTPSEEELAELRSAIIRRDGALFLHEAAGFVKEHRRHAQRWDLAAAARDLPDVAIYVGGSDEDPYEHRQVDAARARVPGADVLTFPGGHLTTSEHPDLLAAAIRDIASRHGVGPSKERR
ncbi:alpha/beta hydrolase [Kribbella sp. NPDC026596]|uniref:alpha/beta fold hydrolase n=1 Tax=Kribbella sp. NPDC026596 TaxID=3155122 RepID=UPI0033D5EE30